MSRIPMWLRVVAGIVGGVAMGLALGMGTYLIMKAALE